MRAISFCSLVLICLIMLGATTVNAAEGEVIKQDQITYRILGEGNDETKGEVSVSSAVLKKKTDYSIRIPSEIEYNDKYYSVVSIDDKAFFQTKIKHIELPNGVKNIGAACFAECKNLTSIVIPSSCIFIADGAFFDCSGLTEVIFEQGEGNIELTIGNASFAYTFITELNLADRIIGIGNASFYGCENLKAVSIGKGLNSIEEGSFSYCDDLELITAAKENKAFRINDNMIYSYDKETLISAPCLYKSIEVKKGTQIIADYAFEGNNNIRSVKLPITIKTISKLAFKECENIESIEIQKGNKNLCSDNNMLLTKSMRTLIAAPCAKGEVVIPEYVKHIGDWAFVGNDKLEKVTIPKTVSDIGMGAFLGCSSLKYVEFESRKTELYSESEYLLDDGVSKQACGIFFDTTEGIEINLPYSKKAYQKNSFESKLLNHCPETLIITTR